MEGDVLVEGLSVLTYLNRYALLAIALAIAAVLVTGYNDGRGRVYKLSLAASIVVLIGEVASLAVLQVYPPPGSISGAGWYVAAKTVTTLGLVLAFVAAMRARKSV